MGSIYGREMNDELIKDCEDAGKCLDEMELFIENKSYDMAMERLNHCLRPEILSRYGEAAQGEVRINVEEAFEAVIAANYLYPKDNIILEKYPFGALYFYRGTVSLLKKEYDAARKDYFLAKNRAPASFLFAFRYGEEFKRNGDMRSYLESTRELFTIAFRPGDIAQCFRNMGYFFVEEQQYRLARTFYVMSTFHQEKNEAVEKELEYISRVTGGTIDSTSRSDVEYAVREYDIPLLGNTELLNLATQMAHYYLEKGEKEMTRYYFDIAYNMSQKDRIEGLIGKLG